jgi:hypothetical protein
MTGTRPEGESQMEERSRALFDFLQLSYQRGLMDDILALGDLLDPNMDTVEMLESFDDAVVAMDLEPVAAMCRDQLQPMLQSLTNAESIDALRAILQTSRPYLTKFIQDGGQKNPLQNVQTLGAIIPHLVVLLKHLAPVAKPYVQPFVRLFVEDSGKQLGRALNAMSRAVIEAHTREPEHVNRIFTDLFSTLDTKQFGRAMEVLANGMLDQRPKVVRWTLGTVFTRIKKRFARS